MIHENPEIWMTMDFLGRRLVSSTAKASRTPEPSWTYLPLGDSVRDGIEVWMQFKITSEIFLPTKSIARFSKYNKNSIFSNRND